ncbi:MAG: AAA family ATPase [Succinivibrio sp.]|nr:AAA family ATPase [Succinivibrio sp.]
MPVISVCSPKGGVGKTTLTSNLAYTFARAGTKVITIDFDPQNALRLYFGIPLSEEGGFIEKIESNGDWTTAALNVGKNLYMLPFGHSTQEDRLKLDSLLMQPNYFKDYQAALFCNPDVLVIADFPPGFSQALKAMADVTDVSVIPLLADAASIALFSQIENEELLEGPFNNGSGYFVVLNEVDNRIKINREIQEFAASNFGDRLLGMIHTDTSVIEAAAQQQAISDFNRNSSAGFDIEIIARKLATILGFDVKQDTIVMQRNPNQKR